MTKLLDQFTKREAQSYSLNDKELDFSDVLYMQGEHWGGETTIGNFNSWENEIPQDENEAGQTGWYDFYCNTDYRDECTWEEYRDVLLDQLREVEIVPELLEISIDSEELAELILNNKDKIGSTEWDIYVTAEGALDCRHYSHSIDGWYQLVDLYSFWNDDDTLSSSVEELASWLESDGLQSFDKITKEIELDGEVYDGATIDYL